MSTTTADRRVDSPMATPFLPMTFDNADPDSSALKLAYAFIPSWKTSEGEAEIERFTDGITNTLTKVTKKVPGKTQAQVDDDALLMRAYGKGTDVLIDREREMKAHTLLACFNLAPPLLARFENGLIYKFVQGDVCSPEDLRKPEVYRKVAALLGQWHGSLPISAITSAPDLEKDAIRKHCGGKDGKPTRPIPNIWSMMQHWIDALPNNTNEERERNNTLDKELRELSARFGETPGLIPGKDYVFSHCDLLSGNVIKQHPSGSEPKPKDPPVAFIDYEYSTPGPAAFDISNHFAEWAGFDCDHNSVPTKSQRKDFLKHYVGSYRIHSISDDDEMVDCDMRADLDQLYEQVEAMRGVPGFYWGIWALIQSMISQIDFDYPTYAELRLSEYWGWKAEMDGSREREGREMTVRERRWAEE